MQGMGRGVRDRDDYCAVLLLARLSFSCACVAGENSARWRESWVATARLAPSSPARSRVRVSARSGRRALAQVRYAERGTVWDEPVALREAFDLAATGRAVAAADRVQWAVTLDGGDRALRG